MSRFSKSAKQYIINDVKSVLDSASFNLISEDLGIGTAEDKLNSFNNYNFRRLMPESARRLYANSDILQNVVDIPAFDATREGFRITSDWDEEGASKLMQERLNELKIDEVLQKYLENYHMYSRGTLLYPIVRHSSEADLQDRLSINLIERIESLNVLPEDDFEFFINNYDPHSPSYLKPKYALVRGVPLHPSRFCWAAYKYFPIENEGVSLLEKVLLATLALRVTNWSLANVMIEIQNKILKIENLDSYAEQTPDLRATGENKKTTIIQAAKRWLTSSRMMILDKNDDYDRQMFNAQGIKDTTDFFWQYLGAVSGYPESVWKGQALGKISQADTDQRKYAEKVRAKLQHQILLPAIKYIINLLKYEKSNKFYRKFGTLGEFVNFDIEFEKIWQPDAVEESQINLRNSQRGKIDIEIGVRDSEQVRRELYPELEDEPLPEIPEQVENSTVASKELEKELQQNLE